MKKEFCHKILNEEVKISVVRNEENVVSSIKFGVGEIHTLTLIEEHIYGRDLSGRDDEHRFILCIDESPIFSFDRGSARNSYFNDCLSNLFIVLKHAIKDNHELKFGTFYYEDKYGERVPVSNGYFEINPCRSVTVYFQYPMSRVICIGNESKLYTFSRHESRPRIRLGA